MARAAARCKEAHRTRNDYFENACRHGLCANPDCPSQEGFADAAAEIPGTLTVEEQAIAAYEKHCQDQRLTPTDEGRKEWVSEWLECEGEYRQAAYEAHMHQMGLWVPDDSE